MLRPSTAPRWNTATRTLRRASAALAARARKRGGAATATSAQAPAFRSGRRVSIASSSPLELRRADHQRRQLLDVGVGRSAIVRRLSADLGARELRGEHGPCLIAGLPVQQAQEQTI